MRILVTFAVEAEFAPWRKLHHFRREVVNVESFSASRTNCESYEASVFGADVDVFLTGIGWESKAKHVTRRALRALLRRKPQLVLSTGLAGGLNRSYKAGQVIAATELV